MCLLQLTLCRREILKIYKRKAHVIAPQLICVYSQTPYGPRKTVPDGHSFSAYKRTEQGIRRAPGSKEN